MDLGSQERNATSALMVRLLDSPQKFDFFQAVRLLETMRSSSEDQGKSTHALLGHAGPPQSESVRFRGIPTLSFPASAICNANQTCDDIDGSPQQLELAVAFLSLFGTQGSLPRHYTEHIIERVREGDFNMLEFLNLFQHRSISFLFRAWAKHRLPPAVELGRLHSRESRVDQVTALLLSLCGLGTSSLISQSHIDSDFVAYYSGHLSRPQASAESIQQILSDYYSIRVEVREFVGRWIPIPVTSQTSLAKSPRSNANLGANAVSGARTYDHTSTVRVLLGPLNRHEFQRFLPGAEDYEQLCQITRYMLGMEFDFEVQLVLKAIDVPMGQLGGGIRRFVLVLISGFGLSLRLSIWMMFCFDQRSHLLMVVERSCPCGGAFNCRRGLRRRMDS